MEKTVIITGGSSGIGLAAARSLRAAGCRVYELSRRSIAHADGIRHITADVADEGAVRGAVAQVLAETGRVDILICNAGFGISGAAEFTENAEAAGLLAVNLFGAVNPVRAVLPAMRAQGDGRIVFVSSVAAAISIPFQAWYSVSKAALSSYAAALREEVRPFGISVCAALPGDIRTGFTAARVKSPLGDDVYAGRIARSVAVMEHDEQTGIPPERAGAQIARIALLRRVRPTYVIGASYAALMVLARVLPDAAVSRIVGKIYG